MDSEYQMLIKLAYVNGWAKLIFCVISTTIWCCCFIFVKRKTTTPPKTEYIKFPQAEWYSDTAEFARIIIFIAMILILIAITKFIPEILISFLNPEYWALMQLIK